MFDECKCMALIDLEGLRTVYPALAILSAIALSQPGIPRLK
jgi:hypothetical protein